MWNRRQFVTSLTAVSISMIAIPIQRVGAQSTGAMPPAMPGMAGGMMTPKDCIESCWRSHVMCLETAHYCLEKGGMHVRPAHQALLADCADMCIKAADSLLRRSSQHAAVCIACAELCDACAKECEAFKDDQRMLLCARTCRDCAKHCRDMSKMPI